MVPIPILDCNCKDLGMVSKQADEVWRCKSRSCKMTSQSKDLVGLEGGVQIFLISAKER